MLFCQGTEGNLTLNAHPHDVWISQYDVYVRPHGRDDMKLSLDIVSSPASLIPSSSSPSADQHESDQGNPNPPSDDAPRKDGVEIIESKFVLQWGDDDESSLSSGFDDEVVMGFDLDRRDSFAS